jgi:hypothetical protein
LIDQVDVVKRLRTAATNGPTVYAAGDLCVESHDDDDAGWGKLLARPTELSGNITSRGICERVGGKDEGVRIFLINI